MKRDGLTRADARGKILRQIKELAAVDSDIIDEHIHSAEFDQRTRELAIHELSSGPKVLHPTTLRNLNEMGRRR